MQSCHWDSAAPSLPLVPAVPTRHPMITSAHDGILVPNPKYPHVTVIMSLAYPLTFVCAALRDPAWRAVMQVEFDAL